MLPPLGVLRICDAGRVHRAEKKAGVRESNRAAADRICLQIGQTRLGSAERVIAICSPSADIGPDVLLPFPSGLVGVVAADPCGAPHRRRLVIMIRGRVGWPDPGRYATLSRRSR